MRYKQNMLSETAMKRMQVIFSGRVQGVGFRYMVCQAAEPFEVTGFVRNLWDGNVEVVAEGTQQVLVDLLHAIRETRLARNIAGDQVDWKPATEEYDRFGILF